MIIGLWIVYFFSRTKQYISKTSPDAFRFQSTFFLSPFCKKFSYSYLLVSVNINTSDGFPSSKRSGFLKEEIVWSAVCRLSRSRFVCTKYFYHLQWLLPKDFSVYFVWFKWHRIVPTRTKMCWNKKWTELKSFSISERTYPQYNKYCSK